MIYYTNYIISFAIVELGMEQIVAQDSSWMKNILATVHSTLNDHV